MTISREWNQGEGSVGRGSPVPSRPPFRWVALGLLPHEQVTIRLDLGWDSTEQVGMCAFEAMIPGTKELIAMHVVPIRLYDTLDNFLGDAQRWQGDLVRELFGADPFP